MTKLPIILIGAMGVGKSTIATLLAKKLGVPRCELDEIRWDYYDKIGYDKAEAKRLHESGAFFELVNFWKPLEAQSVAMVLAEFPDHVIDFGGGQTVYEDEALFAQVEKVLAPYLHVILLQPSPNLEESLVILKTRLQQSIAAEVGEMMGDILKLNEHFITHPSNLKLAKQVFYTGGKMPAETCAEILAYLNQTT